MSDFFDIFLLKVVLRFAAPLIFAAMGGLLSEKSGVMNIALEGMMLIGAFFGVVGAYYMHSVWLGVLLGLVAAGVAALIHAFWCITLRADQIVAGTAINLLGSGVTVFLLARFWNQSGQSPLVDRLPVFWGTMNILVPVAFMIVPLSGGSSIGQRSVCTSRPRASIPRHRRVSASMSASIATVAW